MLSSIPRKVTQAYPTRYSALANQGAFVQAARVEKTAGFEAAAYSSLRTNTEWRFSDGVRVEVTWNASNNSWHVYGQCTIPNETRRQRVVSLRVDDLNDAIDAGYKVAHQLEECLAQGLAMPNTIRGLVKFASELREAMEAWEFAKLLGHISEEEAHAKYYPRCATLREELCRAYWEDNKDYNLKDCLELSPAYIAYIAEGGTHGPTDKGEVPDKYFKDLRQRFNKR